MHKINVSPNREDTRQQMQRNKLTKYQTTQRMRYSPKKGWSCFIISDRLQKWSFWVKGTRAITAQITFNGSHMQPGLQFCLNEFQKLKRALKKWTKACCTLTMDLLNPGYIKEKEWIQIQIIVLQPFPFSKVVFIYHSGVCCEDRTKAWISNQSCCRKCIVRDYEVHNTSYIGLMGCADAL